MGARAVWIAAALLATAVATASTLALMEWRRSAHADDGLRQRVGQRVRAKAQTEVDCAALLLRRPLVLLALGQSNAGNHGSAAPNPREPISVVTDQGRCYRSTDPLPGATGASVSIWGRLPGALAAAGVDRQVVLAVLAVDA